MKALSAQRVFVSGVDRFRRHAGDDVTESFLAFRKATLRFGPLEPKQRELCMLAGFTALRNEGGFRVHCARAAEAGATLQEVQQVVLLMFGSNIGLYPAAESLDWAREEFEGIAKKAKRRTRKSSGRKAAPPRKRR